MLIVYSLHSRQFSSNTSNISIDNNLRPSLSFTFLQCANPNKDLTSISKISQNFRKLFINIKSSLLSLNWPFLTISITIKPNIHSLLMKLYHDLLESLTIVQLSYYFLYLICDCCCNCCHDEGWVLRGTCCTELKFVAGVGVWACTVTIGVLLVEVVVYVW